MATRKTSTPRKSTSIAATAAASTGEGPTMAEKTQKARIAASAGSTLTPEQRFLVIQEKAYFLAEKDAFRKDPVAYWYEAEKCFQA